MFSGPCMCRGVLSFWDNDKDYPYVQQGVMHSPVGCLRRNLQPQQLKKMYRDLTGYEFGNDNLPALFQAVMMRLVINNEQQKRYPVVLTPVPTFEYRPPLVESVKKVRYNDGTAVVKPPLNLAISSPPRLNQEGGTSVRGASPEKNSVDPNLYKKPWER